MHSNWVQSSSQHTRTALQRCLTDSCHGAAWEALLLPLVQLLQTLGTQETALSADTRHLPAPTTRVQTAVIDRQPAALELVSGASGAVQRAAPFLHVPLVHAGDCGQAAAHARIRDAAFSSRSVPQVLSPEECMPIVGSTCLVFLTRNGVAIKVFLHQVSAAEPSKGVTPDHSFHLAAQFQKQDRSYVSIKPMCQQLTGS